MLSNCSSMWLQPKACQVYDKKSEMWSMSVAIIFTISEKADLQARSQWARSRGEGWRREYTNGSWDLGSGGSLNPCFPHGLVVQPA